MKYFVWYKNYLGYLLEGVVFWHWRRKTKEIYYFNENDKECDFVECYWLPAYLS